MKNPATGCTRQHSFENEKAAQLPMLPVAYEALGGTFSEFANGSPSIVPGLTQDQISHFKSHLQRSAYCLQEKTDSNGPDGEISLSQTARS